jgi:DNA helicase-2/ATP-dependent DNA helicase PcrA
VTVHDDRAQAGYVAGRVLVAREAGTALKQQAVLFRASHHSGALELELARRNIPFVKFGGLKFVEASHVKDVIGLLRWAENPRDRVAGFRSLHLLPGVGPATARKALDHLEGAGWPRRWRASRCRRPRRRIGRGWHPSWACLRAARWIGPPSSAW